MQRTALCDVVIDRGGGEEEDAVLTRVVAHIQVKVLQLIVPIGTVHRTVPVELQPHVGLHHLRSPHVSNAELQHPLTPAAFLSDDGHRAEHDGSPSVSWAAQLCEDEPQQEGVNEKPHNALYYQHKCTCSAGTSDVLVPVPDGRLSLEGKQKGS